MLPAVLILAGLFLLFHTTPGAPTAGKPITCEAGAFHIGEPASIDCNFRTNITASKRDISITWYTSEVDRGKDVLWCHWSVKTKKHDCNIEMANYTFDGVFTEHLTIKIPAVTTEHGGWYKCFFIASDEIKAHPCELRLQAELISAKTVNKTGDGNAEEEEEETGEGKASLPIILPCVFVAVACCVGLVFLLRRRCAQSRVNRREALEMEEPMIPSGDPKIKALLGGFELQNSELQELMQVLDQEMSKGLNNETNIQADIKMFPTFVNLSPNVSGSVSEDMLVMDLNDKRLKVSLVTLQGQNASLNESKCYTIQEGVRRETVKQLFDFVADSTDDFVKFHRVPTKTLRLVLVLAFPCKHESIDEGYLVKWTKEVEFGEVDDTRLHILLQEALDRKRQTKKMVSRHKDNLAKLKLVAIVNNAVSTLVSVAHGNSNCKIGLIVGRGLNACYLEDWKRVANDSPKDVALHEMVINTELGALGENGCLDFCRTDYDKKLDMNSIRPGSQILEKMVGGMYIGDVVRLVLESLTKDRLLFQSAPLESPLFERDIIDMDVVAIIEEDTEDTEEPYAKTASILDGFKLKHYTPEDLRTVREVCKVVCERAALLTAASLAVLINRVNQPEVRVVADGYLYRRHPRFHDILDEKTRELVRPELKFDIVSPSDESSIGAARIAAAALR